jgi:MSHA pilin protein MshC
MKNQLRSPGFTLIELIVVMVVLGILAAVFIPRSNNPAIIVSTQAEQLGADIRYIQSLAMTQGQRYRINFYPATSPPSYNFTDLSGAVAVAHPSGTTGSVFIAGGVSISLSNLPNSYLSFGGLGTPYTDAATPGNRLGSTATITLTSSGSTRTVQIFPETGMVRVP